MISKMDGITGGDGFIDEAYLDQLSPGVEVQNKKRSNKLPDEIRKPKRSDVRVTRSTDESGSTYIDDNLK